jgi:hypothetical protein
MEDLELYTGKGTTLNVRKRGGKNPNIYSYAARDMVTYLDALSNVGGGGWGVADLSKEEGGSFPGHKSHLNGLDVDITLPIKGGGMNLREQSKWEQKDSKTRDKSWHFYNVKPDDLDVEKTIEFLEHSIKNKAIAIFLDKDHINKVKQALEEKYKGDEFKPTKGKGAVDYGYTFDVVEPDGSLKNISSFNDNRKFYGASIQKPVLALAYLIAGEDLGGRIDDEFLENMILYSASDKYKTSNKNSSILSLNANKLPNVQGALEDLNTSLGLGDSNFQKIGAKRGKRSEGFKGKIGNHQTAKAYSKFMAALMNYKRNEYFNSDPRREAAAKKILDLVSNISSDRKEGEKGYYEGKKIKKLMDDANKQLEGSDIKITKLSGKGGTTPRKGDVYPLARNVSYFVEAETATQQLPPFIFTFYGTGGKKVDRNVIQKGIGIKLAELLKKAVDKDYEVKNPRATSKEYKRMSKIMMHEPNHKDHFHVRLERATRSGRGSGDSPDTLPTGAEFPKEREAGKDSDSKEREEAREKSKYQFKRKIGRFGGFGIPTKFEDDFETRTKKSVGFDEITKLVYEDGDFREFFMEWLKDTNEYYTVRNNRKDLKKTSKRNIYDGIKKYAESGFRSNPDKLTFDVVAFFAQYYNGRGRRLFKQWLKDNPFMMSSPMQENKNMKITKERLTQIIKEEVEAYKASQISELDVDKLDKEEAYIKEITDLLRSTYDEFFKAAAPAVGTPQTKADTGEPVTDQTAHEDAKGLLLDLLGNAIDEFQEKDSMHEDGHDDVPSAVRAMKTMAEDALEMLDALEQMDGTLPTWWTNKMAVSASMLNKMRDYLLVPSEEESSQLGDFSDLGDTNITKDEAFQAGASTCVTEEEVEDLDEQ